MTTIHASETVSGGLRVVMSDGAIWFHPNTGAAPERLGTSSHYIDKPDHCRARGLDHKVYGWSPRPERDWSALQRAAYLSAWENAA